MGSRVNSGITIKSESELDHMREAGRVVAETKSLLKNAVQSGLSTGALDSMAENYILKSDAKPSFKGYMGFPATICVSINEEIVHGIPSTKRILKNGDIVSIDVGAVVNGFHSDSAFTIAVGEVPQSSIDLITATKESLKIGISNARVNNRIGDVSSIIQQYAENLGYGVVRQYVGHGIGRSLHEEPQVPNYGEPGRGHILRAGMVLAIEPMLNMGGWETKQLKDGWTVVTADNTLSAHFEDTVAILDSGPQVLT